MWNVAISDNAIGYWLSSMVEKMYVLGVRTYKDSISPDNEVYDQWIIR